jgi:diguanylate cyclase (GGDEF)-like protein/PAS domain S-box-containing protein
MSDMAIPGGRLLIVDDDPLMRGMASRTLRHAGFAVEEADGGKAALALFASQAFELVLLDVMMPDMDGYAVCAQIRRLAHGARVPILMLTGLNDTESIELAYRAGATDFISKPINWTLLSHRVRYCLRAGLAVESAMRSRERLERAQSIAHMGSWEVAAGTGQLVCSPELGRIFGATAQEMACDTEQAFLDRVSEQDRATVREMRRAVRDDGAPYQITFRIERFDGVVRTVHEQAGPVFDAAGRQTAVEGITQDITERIAAEQRINRLVRYDALTGLPNRDFFDKLVGPSLARSSRLGSACALMHLDIDQFRSVNDALGHQTGNAVLITMAGRLQSAIRGADLGLAGRIPRESVLARVGANAFTLLLVDIGNDQQAGLVAERLLHVVAQPIAAPEGGPDLVLSASIGIALYPRDAQDGSSLSRCAEQALHAAKACGRAQHRFFDEEMNRRASARLVREGELRLAIGEGQLRLHYQPKVDTVSGAVVGAEALVRWQHPLQGMVAPAEFIPLAEESGQILALTDWVLETVCAHLSQWMGQGLAVVPMSVNLASPSFASDRLETQLTQLLQRYRLPARLLVLEVTESLLMADAERVIERLGALRERGFGVSLDDFGTGYSSLGYLKRFPIDELKIDRAFVTDAWRGGRDGAIAASIIALGRAFGLRVVAEGVETRAQADCLNALGCAMQQGYLFDRPMPEQEFAKRLVRAAANVP